MDGSLRPGDVHVWRVPLDLPEADVAALAARVAPDEAAWAAEQRLESVRRRVLVTRAALREILAGYAGCAPTVLRFAVEPSGRPRLAAPPADLRFNLSHTEGLALVAVTRGRQVGVDVERLKDRARWPEIARRYFTAREAAQIADLRGFLTVWTRKEAYVKARGAGIGFGLDRFEVTVAGAGALIGEPGWTLRDVPMPEPYVAAVAVEGDLAALGERDWSP